jgi:hypothetical protein
MGRRPVVSGGAVRLRSALKAKQVAAAPPFAWAAAAAHPSCVVAQPYRDVAPAFRHVVRATPSIATRSRTDTN